MARHCSPAIVQGRCHRGGAVGGRGRRHHRQNGDNGVRVLPTRPTRNPHDLERTPGGSSQDPPQQSPPAWYRWRSARKPTALGDPSCLLLRRIRRQATHGLITRGGVPVTVPTLITSGVFARTLDDVALLLDVLAGHDPRDPDTRPVATPNFRATLAESPPLQPSSDC